MISQHDVLVAVLGLIASVLGGLILGMLRKVLHAQRDTSAKVEANTEAKTATVLDVASLQGWARRVDAELAERHDASGDLAFRTDIDIRLKRIEQFMAEFEGKIHGKATGADQISR